VPHLTSIFHLHLTSARTVTAERETAVLLLHAVLGLHETCLVQLSNIMMLFAFRGNANLLTYMNNVQLASALIGSQLYSGSYKKSKKSAVQHSSFPVAEY
jgi:hypothetical protein